MERLLYSSSATPLKTYPKPFPCRPLLSRVDSSQLYFSSATRTSQSRRLNSTSFKYEDPPSFSPPSNSTVDLPVPSSSQPVPPNGSAADPQSPKHVATKSSVKQKEICHFHSNVCKMSTSVSNDMDDLCACHESRENCNSRREFYMASIVSSPSLGDCMKFMFLFGLFTLQDSLPAVAGGMQIMPYLGDIGDISTSFASTLLLIFFSELGDKTFFIAALLAARNSAGVVFTGTFGALATMTIISVVLGRTFHYVDEILPFRLGGSNLPIDDIAAVCLLVYFGISTLVDASSNEGLKAEDEQKEAELAVSKVSGNGAGVLTTANTMISSFLLVFVAEWGDKSFFSTIALAATSSPLGVIGGALAGHGLATLIAVLSGSLLGSFLSEKVIGYTGGVLFLIFAGLTLIEIMR